MDGKHIYKEKELLTLVASGDVKAFTEIVSHYTPIIYKHLLIYIKDAQKAEELTQDVFIQVWKNRSKLGDMDNFPGYIYVITRNQVLMAFREKLKIKELPLENVLKPLASDPQITVEYSELNSAINRGIGLLPPRRQEVFRLSRFENKSYEEIAAQLGVSRSAVKQHIIEALVFLRYYIKEELGVIVSFLLWLSAGR